MWVFERNYGVLQSRSPKSFLNLFLSIVAILKPKSVLNSEMIVKFLPVDNLTEKFYLLYKLRIFDECFEFLLLSLFKSTIQNQRFGL